MRLTILIAILSLTISCSQEDITILPESAPPPVPMNPISLHSDVVIPDGTYMLKTMASQPYEGNPVTLKVTSNKISGKGPVNSFNANLVQGKISPLAVTRMAGQPEFMQVESQIFKLLEGASLDITDDGDLAVRQGGIARLMFQRSEN